MHSWVLRKESSTNKQLLVHNRSIRRFVGGADCGLRVQCGMRIPANHRLLLAGTPATAEAPAGRGWMAGRWRVELRRWRFFPRMEGFARRPPERRQHHRCGANVSLIGEPQHGSPRCRHISASTQRGRRLRAISALTLKVRSKSNGRRGSRRVMCTVRGEITVWPFRSITDEEYVERIRKRVTRFERGRGVYVVISVAADFVRYRGHRSACGVSVVAGSDRQGLGCLVWIRCRIQYRSGSGNSGWVFSCSACLSTSKRDVVVFASND